MSNDENKSDLFTVIPDSQAEQISSNAVKARAVEGVPEERGTHSERILAQEIEKNSDIARNQTGGGRGR